MASPLESTAETDAVYVRPRAGQLHAQPVGRANDDVPLPEREYLQFLSVQGMMAAGHSYMCRAILADMLSL
jgi:hypothetical protein